MRKILLSLLCAAMTLNLSAVEGALSGKFSTNSAGTTAIQFSQGNLQYRASTDTWRFAENQYDIIGEDNKNISSSYEGWIDLFGWGTSGYDNKYPYMTSENPSHYGAGNRKSITGTEYDWGVHNPISNGGNVKGAWRTLDTELTNIIENRPNAEKLFGFGSINGVNGMILLPDDWKDPDGLPAFKPALENGLVWNSEDYAYKNANEDNFSQNTYTKSEWNVMEANGAVFLPVTGYRLGTTFKGTSEEEGIEVGNYWMSTYPGWMMDYYHTSFNSFADNILVCNNSFSEGRFDDNAHFGYAVRLIKDYEAPAAYYAVTITLPEHGTISVQETGVDLSAVAEGTKLHFVATPEDGYELDAWSGCAEDGSLTVNADATVTCTFKQQTFQVTFVDWNDAVLKAAQTVVWGEAAVPPADPTREGFKFTGWDTDFSSVKSDLTVKAQYVEGVFFTVTFLDWDATFLFKETVEQGKDAKGPAVTPTREGYTFVSWSKPITNITADLTVIAQYEVAKVYYTVTYLDWDATPLGTEKVEEGKDAKGPAVTPTREGYTFTGWSKSIKNITADLTVIAQYEVAKVYYTVTFWDWDATELFKETVEEGKDAKGPDVKPYREGYKFIGWSKPITNITADLLVIAQYEKIPEGLDQITNDQSPITNKVIIDGHLFILRDGKMYNAQGAEVR